MEQKSFQQLPTDVTKKTSKIGKTYWIKEYFKKRPPKKRLLVITGVSLSVLAIGIAGLVFFGPTAPEPDPVPEIVSTYVAPPETAASPLTGVEVSPDLAKRPITGIMIENSIDARPQSGMHEAGIVFEAIAEGGITRFLALFQESRPGNIGPIRSARPYYVQWAAGYDASYLHSGGSGEALALIRSLGVKDLDHGALSSSIADRVSSRYAPHNVYSNMDKIDPVNTSKGYTSSSFAGYERKEDTPPTVAAPATATNINYNISGANYNTAYTYNAEGNNYLRNMAGIPHKDQESGTHISPKILVAMITDYGYHPNGIHSSYKVVGSGPIQVFQDGVVLNGNWSKGSATAPLVFTDEAGQPFKFNAGQMWINPIPSGRVSFSP